MNQIAFILHGKIKKQDKIIAAIEAVFGNSAALTFLITQHGNHAIQLATNAVSAGATHIICVGGDGSLNEVVNGVMRAGQTGKVSVKVGLLPHGTGNDFARTMDVTYDINLLQKWIDEDSFRVIDIGWLAYYDATGKAETRYFVNISDVGIGGTIAQDLASSSKIWGPTITYQKAILTALLTYKNQPMKVHADTFDHHGNTMSLIVANGKFFGGGMGIAPHALPDDKLFSIVIVGAISMFEYIRNIGNIKKSKKIEHPEIKYLTASEISIESSAGRLPVDMDGEFLGYSPVDIKIVPGAIKFISPK